MYWYAIDSVAVTSATGKPGTSSLVVVGAVVVALVLGALVGFFLGRNRVDDRSQVGVLLFVVLALLVVTGAGVLVANLVKAAGGAEPEIQMGVVVVGAIAVLMTVLFILAAGFRAMLLTDAGQALGLPEGSIRAMIALVLIIMFIILGIYLFRLVGSGTWNYMGKIAQRDTTTLAAKYPGRQLLRGASQYDSVEVYILDPVTDDGKRMAQQIITTLGTLVVAVAGFYFGSSTGGGGQTKPATNPVILDANPRRAAKGEMIPLVIVGTEFRSPKAVSLVRGKETMVATDISSSATRIDCTVTIDKDRDGPWDVLVENEDGRQARWPNAFTIT